MVTTPDRPSRSARIHTPKVETNWTITELGMSVTLWNTSPPSRARP